MAKKHSKTHQKYVKKVRRMRKSSFNQVQQNFKIFQDSVDHFNNYESLALDISDDEFNKAADKGSGNEDDYIFFINNNESKKDDIPVVTVESSTDNENASLTDEPTEEKFTLRSNGLEMNNDFIAFSDSSDGELKEEINEELNETINEKSELIVYESTLKEEEEYEEEYGEEEEEEDDNETTFKRSKNSKFPWVLNHDHSKQRDICKWLTLEIKDFISFISPSREEIEIRNYTIKKLRRAVRRLWPDATLHVFGSYATDLYLPGSDIDCAITSKSGDKEHRSYLYELARYLKSNNIATQIEVIAKARVPIIKFVDVESDIQIDVSFERVNGIEVAKSIRNWLDMSPGLRELVLVIKQFLKSRRLNDVHTGGLGGLSIVCLIYSFLHLHPKIRTEEIDPLENLGVLLMDFFELYGKNFAYDDVALSFPDGVPSYIPKSHWKALLPSRSSFSLAIQDPLDPLNNLSRGSFNVAGIKKAFSGGFDLLSNKCYELHEATFKDRIGESILGNVIKYKGDERHFKDERELVKNRAIHENEVYHKKRRRLGTAEIEGLFLDPSDDEILTGGQNDLEMYKLEQPSKKKLKREKMAAKKLQTKTKTKTKTKVKKPEPAPKPKTKSIDKLMGIVSDNEDENNAIEISTNTNTEPIDDHIPLKKIGVDAQTRRDYWLSKGQTLGLASIPNKNI